MDVDHIAYSGRFFEPRLRACACVSIPEFPKREYGCACPTCGAQCKLCTGFGYAEPPRKRVHQILSRIRSQIRRQLRTRGRPPGYVRLSVPDVRTLLRKRKYEEADHWIRDYVEPGPPIRIFDVIIVIDRRSR